MTKILCAKCWKEIDFVGSIQITYYDGPFTTPEKIKYYCKKCSDIEFPTAETLMGIKLKE